MLKRERQAYIVHQVNLHNKVLSATLSAEIDVSEDTIRRDLMELSEEGKLIKVHGGALSLAFNDITYPSRKIYSQDNKKIIAQKAAALIKDGMFVLTGGGTTGTRVVSGLLRSLSFEAPGIMSPIHRRPRSCAPHPRSHRNHDNLCADPRSTTCPSPSPPPSPSPVTASRNTAASSAESSSARPPSGNWSRGGWSGARGRRSG